MIRQKIALIAFMPLQTLTKKQLEANKSEKEKQTEAASTQLDQQMRGQAVDGGEADDEIARAVEETFGELLESLAPAAGPESPPSAREYIDDEATQAMLSDEDLACTQRRKKR